MGRIWASYMEASTFPLSVPGRNCTSFQPYLLTTHTQTTHSFLPSSHLQPSLGDHPVLPQKPQCVSHTSLQLFLVLMWHRLVQHPNQSGGMWWCSYLLWDNKTILNVGICLGLGARSLIEGCCKKKRLMKFITAFTTQRTSFIV